MSNICIDLDPGGAPSDVSLLGKTKTISVDSPFQGVIIIEGMCGGSWTQIPGCQFQSPGNKTIEGVFQQVRVAGGPSGVPSISISGDAGGSSFVALPAVGTPVDVDELGTFNTIIVAGLNVGDLLKVQISDDGVNWSDLKSFQANGLVSLSFVACWMRVVYTGSGAPDICVGAANDSITASALNVVYWSPGAPVSALVSDNTFAEFWEAHALCEELIASGHHGVTLFVDGTYSTDTLTFDPGGAREAVINNVCMVTARPGDGGVSDYDMSLIEVTNFQDSGPDSVFIANADNVRWINPYNIVGHGMALISASDISEFISLDNASLRFGGGRCENVQLAATSQPLIKVADGAFFSAVFGTGDHVFSPILGATYDPFGAPWATGPTLGPVLDANGVGFLLIEASEYLATKDTVTDSVGGAFVQVTIISSYCSMDYRQAGLAGSTVFVGLNNGESRQAQPARRIVTLVGPVAHDGASDVIPDWGVTYLCDTTLGDVDIDLPPAAIGKGESIHAKNASGGGSVNLAPSGDEVVDVAALAAGVSTHLESDGSTLPSASGTPTAAYTGPVGTEMTMTDAGAAFTAALVGQSITIAGATTPANDGTFVITAVTPTTIEYTNADGVAEAAGASTYSVSGLGRWVEV